jgi:hypothetical protein
MQETLRQMDSVLGELMRKFPEANYDISSTNLPQDSQVPRSERED